MACQVMPRDAPCDFVTRYRILRELGSGATSRVFEAFDEVDCIPVALKELDLVEVSHEFALTEFRVIRSVRHPNLIHLYALHLQHSTALLSMELVRGRDLGHLIETTPADALEENVCVLIEGLLEGVRALHCNEIVHGDIKPTNILLRGPQEPALADFGLSSWRGRDRAQAWLGSLAYAAPELLAGSPRSRASDMFSVGATISHLLIGSPPSLVYAADGPDVLVDSRLEALARAGRPVLSEWASFASACLARRPEQRPALTTEPPAQNPTPGEAHHGRELALLSSYVALPRRRGAPRRVDVVGPAGLARTRFLQDLAAAQPSDRVLYVRCHDREFLPFQPVEAIVDGLDERGCVGGHADVFRDRLLRAAASIEALVEEFADLLVEFCGTDVGSALVVVDDADRGDEDSLRFFERVLRDHRAKNLTLVFGYDDALEQATRFVVRLESPSRPLVVELHRGTLMTLPEAELGMPGAPKQTDPVAQDVLRLLSTCNGPVRRTHLVEFIDALDDGLVIEALCREGVLRPDRTPGSVGFVDPRAAAAWRARLSPQEIMDLSGRWVDFLARAEPTDYAQRAHHTVLAERRGEVAALAERAADDCRARHAPAQEARLLVLALEDASAPRLSTLIRLADAQRRAGAVREAAATYARLAENDPPRAQQHLSSAALLLFGAGLLEEGTRLTEAVAAQLGIRVPRGSVARLIHMAVGRVGLRRFGAEDGFPPSGAQSTRGLATNNRRTEAEVDLAWTICAGLGQYEAHPGFQAQMLVGALRLADPQRLCRALGMEAIYQGLVGSRGRWMQNVLRRLERLAADHESSDGGAFAYFALGYRAFLVGNSKECVALCERAIESFRRRGVVCWERDLAETFRLFGLLGLGRLGELTTTGEFLRGTWAARAQVATKIYYDLCCGYVSDLLSDRPREAVRRLRQARAELMTPSFEYLWYTAMAAVLIYSGRYRTAATHLLSGFRRYWPSLIYEHARLTLLWYWSVAVIRAGPTRWQRLGLWLGRWWLGRERHRWGPAMAAALAQGPKTGDQGWGMAIQRQLEDAGLGVFATALGVSENLPEAVTALEEEGVERPARWARPYCAVQVEERVT